MRTRLPTSIRCLLLGLLLPGMALGAPSKLRELSVTLEDAQRCLLLFGATGDDAFLRPLPGLAKRYEQQLADQPASSSMTLWNLWLLHQRAVDSARANNAPDNPRLAAALREGGTAVGLLPNFLPPVAAEADSPAPSLADNLRELALLEAQSANRAYLDDDEQARRERIGALQHSLDEQFGARPATPADDALRSRWRYLRLTERADGTLLYPFTAQVDNLLGRVGD